MERENYWEYLLSYIVMSLVSVPYFSLVDRFELERKILVKMMSKL